MRFRSTPGLAAWSALNLMPVLRQMAMAVSPATTMCLRGAAARVTGSIWRRAGGGAGAVGAGCGCVSKDIAGVVAAVLADGDTEFGCRAAAGAVCCAAYQAFHCLTRSVR